MATLLYKKFLAISKPEYPLLCSVGHTKLLLISATHLLQVFSKGMRNRIDGNELIVT
jgi:hypothetical protein